MDTPDLMDTPAGEGPGREPAPPLCGDRAHRHGGPCGVYATEDRLLDLLRSGGDLTEADLVGMPGDLLRRIPELVAQVEAELDVDLETITDGLGNVIRTLRRPRPALDENLTAVRAQALQGLHAREAIDRLSEASSPDPTRELRDVAGQVALDRIRRELVGLGATTDLAGSTVFATIVDDYGDGLLIRVRPR